MRSIFVAAMVMLSAPQVFAGDEDYKPGADSVRREGVPRGAVTKDTWHSRVFPGTVRDYWVYVPAQYDGKKPACVMVFQDGQAYVREEGDFRVPVVFDNLIHKGEMPVTIGIFINPGQQGDNLPKAPWKSSNRSFEYDTLSDQYARFLLEEILPEVGKRYKLTDDPECRAICGISSGGICAFTVAWQRPDAFRKVLSHVGSFTNIRGGHVYPALIRFTPNKPIRVFLQDGSNDLDNQFGNWWLANLQMESALKYKKYDAKLIGGDGRHSGKHGGSILPDSLRWLWRKADAVAGPGNKEPPIQKASDAVIKPQLAKSGVIPSEAAKVNKADWGEMRRYLTGETFGTKDVLTAAAVVKPGKAVHRAHRHAQEEYLIVTEGSGTWSLDGKQSPAKPGDILYVEPWVYHGLTNTGTQPLVFVVVRYNGKGITLPPRPDDRPDEQ